MNARASSGGGKKSRRSAKPARKLRHPESPSQAEPSASEDAVVDPIAADAEPTAPALPASVGPETAAMARAAEGIETSLRMQAEILRRMHDRQEELGGVLKDQRRHDMVIQSTRSLNDAFWW